MRKVVCIVMLVVAVGLACSSKDARNGIPNKLQDKYTGYSNQEYASFLRRRLNSSTVNRITLLNKFCRRKLSSSCPEDSLTSEDKRLININLNME